MPVLIARLQPGVTRDGYEFSVDVDADHPPLAAPKLTWLSAMAGLGATHPACEGVLPFDSETFRYMYLYHIEKRYRVLQNDLKSLVLMSHRGNVILVDRFPEGYQGPAHILAYTVLPMYAKIHRLKYEVGGYYR